MSNLENLVGVKVKLTTTLDNEIIGRIYAYDSVTNTITVVTESDNKSQHKLQLVKHRFLKKIEVLDKRKKEDSGTREIGYVSPALMSKRLAEGVRLAREDAQRIGVDVTSDAQKIFDTIFKTLPQTRWHEKSIIVLDEVRVDPPYTAASCFAKNPESHALQLVKKIVDGARKKMATHPTQASDERKGG